MSDGRNESEISILKVPDQAGNQCVGIVLSKNATFETADHDLRAGVALSPDKARLVIQKIQSVLLEIETAP